MECVCEDVIKVFYVFGFDGVEGVMGDVSCWLEGVVVEVGEFLEEFLVVFVWVMGELGEVVNGVECCLD